MPNYIECLGLDFLTESEESVSGLMGYIAQEGKAIVGYYGFPYFNQHFGDAQFILRTIRNDETKQFEVSGIDVHSSGNCVWNTRISQMDISRKDADKLEKRLVIHRVDDKGGMAVVNLVNADVLPCFDEGTEIKMQMIAFPSFIQYFENEEAYIESQPDGKDGHKWLLGEGTLFPAGLMTNRNPDSDKFESDEELDNLTSIRGTVKKLYHGVFELSGEKENMYIRCIIGTEYGDLEIVHTIDDVEESQRSNIRVGATVNGLFVLSGDPAIYEYENGMVLNEANDFSILRTTFAGADPERLRYALSEDAIYVAGYNQETCRGRDAIVERIKTVQSTDRTYFAYFATITSIDPGDAELPYKQGTKCIVLAENEEKNYTAVAFITINKDGRISKIETSTNSRYHFQIHK